MLLRLLILLTVVPLVELTILLRIAERFQWGPTIALVVVTGVLGAWLARREGVKVLSRIQADLAAGIVPTQAMADGALILAAGLVLITPGVLTDLCGFALLVAPIRAVVRKTLVEVFKRRVVMIHRTGPETQRGPEPFIDVEATVEDADETTAESHD
ncbi:MAG: FxsA family protein [Planctomycetota bacterium]|jgi:UPF0716 protein FxsA